MTAPCFGAFPSAGSTECANQNNKCSVAAPSGIRTDLERSLRTVSVATSFPSAKKSSIHVFSRALNGQRRTRPRLRVAEPKADGLDVQCQRSLVFAEALNDERNRVRQGKTNSNRGSVAQ